MAKVSFPSIGDDRSEPPSRYPRLLSWRGCRTSWSGTPFSKGPVEVVGSEVGHHDTDVQRNVCDDEKIRGRRHAGDGMNYTGFPGLRA